MAGLLSRLNTAEERPSDYAHINRESESRKAKRSNFERKTEPNMQGLWDSCRQDGVPAETADCRKTGTLFQEQLLRIFPDSARHQTVDPGILEHCRIIIPSTYT